MFESVQFLANTQILPGIIMTELKQEKVLKHNQFSGKMMSGWTKISKLEVLLSACTLNKTLININKE